MDTNIPKICISLCTFKRPVMLDQALQSLKNILIPDGVDIIFLLGDNEKSNKENQTLFERFRRSVDYPCEFLEEPNQGITFIRNRILDRVREIGTDFLLIFDDDQILHERWLVEILNCQKKYQADVVRGHVIYNYSFAKGSGSELFHHYNKSKKTYRTGDLLFNCGEGNVLMKMSLVTKLGLRHNMAFNMTGGSDSLFFHQMFDAGGKIVYCEEAIAYEEVPQSRTTDEWVLKRCFRNGFTRYLIHKERVGKSYAVRKNLWYWLKNYLQLRYEFMLGKECNVDRRIRKVYLSGVINSVMGKKFAEYDEIHGY